MPARGPAACAGKGANLVLAARGGDSLDEAAAECRAAGGRAIGVLTDVADHDQVQALTAAAVTSSAASTCGSTTPPSWLTARSATSP